MSNYTTKAYHPMTGELETVLMLDNYFGRHKYAVQFPDGDIFREMDVEFPVEEDDKKTVKEGVESE